MNELSDLVLLYLIMKFQLDFSNVMSLPFSKYEKNFTFFLNGKKYETSRVVADILSPIIRKYHYFDETINEFYINTEFTSWKSFDFNNILDLANFNLKDITEDQIQYYREVFLALGNSKAYLNFVPQLKEEINHSNVFNRIMLKKQYIQLIHNHGYNEDNFVDSNSVLNQEIDFIASHFSELDQGKLLSLDSDLITSIIKSDKLQLKDEDTFFEFIIRRFRKNKKDAFLFNFIEFFNVSIEKVEQFFNFIHFDDVTQEIWKNLTQYIIKSHKAIQDKSKFVKELDSSLQFPYHDGVSKDGIIHYLSNKTKGNIHDNKTIEVTANGFCGSHSPKFLVDFDGTRIFHSYRNSENWVCYDFKDKKIKISHYSIESVNWYQNEHNLRNWIIETSDNCTDWMIVDKQCNSDILNGPGRIGTFKVEHNVFSRYVRLRQTGPNWKNEDVMILKSIEFYGNLINSNNE